MSHIEVQKLSQYDILYEMPTDISTFIIIGGRGGAKTYEVSKFVAYSSTIKRKRCVILRDEKELIRESILNEVLLRFDTADENGQLSKHYQRLDTGIKDRRTGNMMVFTKGFRASNTEKRANLKSISDIDIAVVEEAEDIRDMDKFNTFVDSIRKRGAIVIIILNTPDINHWIIKTFFTLEDAGDGFYDIIPKKIDGVHVIKTSYEDNPFLPETIVERYRSYGDPESHLYNKFYYNTAILGLASTGRKGQIFTKWKPISNKEFNEVDARSLFGLDFGLASPAGIVEVKLVKNDVYIRELNYKPLSVREIALLLARLGIVGPIVADSAEPHSISKLRRGWDLAELQDLSEVDKQYTERLVDGFEIYPAMKGPGSILDGINLLIDSNVYVTEDSSNLWTEYASYIWAVDKNKNPTGDPIDDFNHLIDPVRYVRKAKGRYF